MYGKVKKVLGFGVLDDDEEGNPAGYGTANWREGRSLIEGDLNGRTYLGSATVLGRSSHSRQVDEHDTVTPSKQQQSDRLLDPIIGRNSQTLYIPPAQRSENAKRQADRPTAAAQAAEEEDENVFSGFAHRVRNTIDNVERPEWLSDLGRRPKWMGGRDGDEGSGQTDPRRGLGRWFGGRPSDGRVRL